jgi:hypothetical protein
MEPQEIYFSLRIRVHEILNKGAYKCVRKARIFMKKVLVLILLIATIILSSCRNKIKEPQFTLSGITYNTGFYNGLYTLSEHEFDGDLVGNSSKLWDEEAVIIDEYKGYKISYTPFDMYSLTIGMWKNYLFVPNEQLEDAQSYYFNPDNFDYYYAKVDRLSKEYIDVKPISSSFSIDETITSINNITSNNQKKLISIIIIIIMCFIK